MDNFYIACDLNADHGRVVLGTLRKGRLTFSEVHRFQSLVTEENGSQTWDIPHLHGEILKGLREIGTYKEIINSISCHSSGGDYMLFDQDGSLNTPVHFQGSSPEGMQELFLKIPRQTIYEETGATGQSGSTLFQLASGKTRHLNHAAHLLPIADGFNYLLSGTPRVEMSSAGATQLFNPLTKAWSERLLSAARLPAKLFPKVVPAGTQLGLLQADIAADTKLDDVQVLASCSDEIAASLAGLPLGEDENWAYMRMGSQTLMGTGIAEPVVSEAAGDYLFSNQIGYAGSVGFHKQIMGLKILEECEQFWREQDDIDVERNMLMHFAGETPPFESLVDFTDPRFLKPGDMPLKIQTFCRETNQTVPRKPGAVIRCILESLALLYRHTLREMESVTGTKINRIYVLEGQDINLLYHFAANALQLPLVIVPPGSAAVGNIIVQALSQGHLKSPAEAREVLRNSIKTKTISPHATAWDEAYARLSFGGAGQLAL